MYVRVIIWALVLLSCIRCQAQSVFKYDHANRLIQVSSNCSGTLYTYDANGNRKSITQISILTTSTVLDERCGNDGQIIVKPQVAGTAYQYAWTNGQSTGTIKNLSAGNYSVVITEPTSGFTCNQTFVVHPAFKDSINVQTQAVTCIGGNDGTAKINLVTPNPKGTYSYHWSIDSDTSFTSKDSIANQKAGSYSVNIRNSYTGCVKTIKFSIGQPPRFLTGINPTPPSCYKSNDATAQAQVVGDTTQYTFVWTGPSAKSQTTQTITTLSPGTYIVACTQKATGCALTDTILIKETAKFLSLEKTDSKCYKANNGTLKAVVPNDPSQYSYSWTGPFNGTIVTPQLSGLPPGLYRVTVTENFGHHCVESDSISINEPPDILKDIKVTPVACKGQADGIAEAVVSGSVTQYTYSWYSNTQGLTLSQNDYKATGLATGLYTLTVTPINGTDCSASKQFEVQEAAVDLSSKLYPNPTTGQVTIAICSQVQGPITYSIYSTIGQLLKSGTVQNSNGILTLDLSSFAPATYAITLIVDGSKYNFGVIKI